MNAKDKTPRGAVEDTPFYIGDSVLVKRVGSGYKRGKIVSFYGTSAKVDFVGGGTDVVPFHLLKLSNSASCNAVVAEAVANARAVANAGVKTVKVTLETVTFNQGVKVETRFMSVAELKTLLKMLGRGGDADSFVARLEQKGQSDIAIASPDLYAAQI